MNLIFEYGTKFHLKMFNLSEDIMGIVGEQHPAMQRYLQNFFLASVVQHEKISYEKLRKDFGQNTPLS